MKTMVAFISRQLWPQIVAVEYYKPENLILLHSADERESLNPAKRLEKFISRQFPVLRNQISLQEIPYDSIEGIQRVLSSLDIGPACINLTGGNKLMTLAGYEWAKKHDCGSF